MITMKILVFVSPHCPHCPDAVYKVRKIAPEYEKYGLTFEKIRTKTKEGKELSSQYNIQATPTILFLDEEGNELKRSVGVPSDSSLRNKIEKLLGLRKSILEKIFKFSCYL